MRRERAKLTTSLIVFAALAPACPRPRVSARGRLRDVTQRDRQGTSWGRDWELSVLRFTARRQYECGAARPIRAHGFREQCERRQSWPGGVDFFQDQAPPPGAVALVPANSFTPNVLYFSMGYGCRTRRVTCKKCPFYKGF